MNKKIISLFTVLAILLISVLISNYTIVTTEYDYTINDTPSVKVLFISDLHGRMFGINNKALIKKISAQNPDIICLGGDFIDEDNTSDDNEELH